jgi:hypothetical protein
MYQAACEGARIRTGPGIVIAAQNIIMPLPLFQSWEQTREMDVYERDEGSYPLD